SPLPLHSFPTRRSSDLTEIRLSVEEQDSEVLIKIGDRGQGIDPEDLPHIFERFRQANGHGRTRNSVGLGLYIVRSLVNAHGGRRSEEHTSELQSRSDLV